jgi:hypothetical protein
MRTTSSHGSTPAPRAGALSLPAATLFASLAVAGSALPATAQVRCGDTIVPESRALLQGDLTCDGVDDAVVVVGPAVLDLNGFTLRCVDGDRDGRRPRVGIALVGSRVELRNGSVVGCERGVEIAGEGRHIVSGVTASGGRFGFRALGDRNRIHACTASGNADSGFAVTGTLNLLTANAAIENDFGFRVTQRSYLRDNVATDNEARGFAVSGDRSALVENRAEGSLVGFAIFGNGNRLFRNRAEQNLTGFLVDAPARRTVLHTNVASANLFTGISVLGSDNALFYNRTEANHGHGIRLSASASDNRVVKTVAERNQAQDLFDETASCGTNRWSNNSFDTCNQGCIQ